MHGPTPTDATDTALEGLGREIERTKGTDPLAPVTVVAPSGFAAVFVRRVLGIGVGFGGRPGWANINCTTVPALQHMLGGPPLAARGLRLAPPAIDLEVIGTRARSAQGWLGEFASHPSAPVELQRALVELRRCPAATLDAISRGHGRGADLVGLLLSVRRNLHQCGLADVADIADEAVTAARLGSSSVRRLGPLVTWQLGAAGPTERALLRLLGARAPDEVSPAHQGGAFTEVRACCDPDEEARSIVRSVMAAAEVGVPLWQQAVFHPPGPTYARILHQHLTAAGVATNGPDLRRLHRSVSGRALLGLLDLAGGDWPRDRVLGWLAAAPITIGPGGRPVPASRWDLVSADAGVVRGARQWQARLRRLADQGGPGADEAADLAAFMDDLLSRAVPPGTSWEALSSWAIGLLDHYLSPASDGPPWPAHEKAAAHQVRSVVSALRDLDRVSGGADLTSFRHAVRTQLERTVLDADELSDCGFGDGVFLAPYSGARGLRFDTVAVAGLADALVPGGDGDVDLLGDDVRRSDPTGALPTRQKRQDAVREDLLCAVAAGFRERIGTLPRTDARTGRAHVPSRWLADLVDTGTRRRGVDSFAAGLADAEPALTAREYELRELDRWVRGGGDPASAHDDRLTRGVEAVRSRVGTRFTRFDGYVGPGRVSALDPGTPVSATRFETYAKCPRRYLFDRVLRVSERVRPEELWRMEPMRRGTLVHAILEDYVTERVDGAPRSLDRLLAIAAARLDEAEAGGLVGKPLLWRMDRTAIVRDLRRFHAEEGALEPIAAELSFGAGDDDDTPPVTVLLDDGRTVAFQGSVDRVDRTSSGQLMVSDYKTGRQGRLGDLTRDPVAGGKLLQLPLYAMAALDRFGGPRPVHARYWLLSGERSAPCFHLVVTPDVEARFRRVVGLIADGVEGGCFPAVPGAPTFGSFSHCTGCDFDVVCPASRDREWSRVYNTPELHGVITLVKGEVPDALAGSVVKRFVDPDTSRS
ncbi:MAG TPA: PD-(D/E)XK nuclease family protein [Acidimicrobiales bacterium]|nr:PD-(D/E)XK nuclease family protein [Acidimicrobiales bacterium]